MERVTLKARLGNIALLTGQALLTTESRLIRIESERILTRRHLCRIVGYRNRRVGRRIIRSADWLNSINSLGWRVGYMFLPILIMGSTVVIFLFLVAE